jgi:hypothetical protein
MLHVLVYMSPVVITTMSLKKNCHQQGAEQSASSINKNKNEDEEHQHTATTSSSYWWTRLEDYCFLTALKSAVSAFPPSDFALTCLTSSGCPQPWRCLGNGICVSFACLVRGLLMGPYLVIDTLFIKHKLYRLYKRYLTEGEVVQGIILFRKPTTNGVNITLVKYAVLEGS